MEHDICIAIRDRRLLEMTYKGNRRVVEPHTLGVDSGGHRTLCAWQLSGGSGEGFRDFHLDSMSGTSVLDEHFPGPRPGYRRDDKTLARVVCQL